MTGPDLDPETNIDFWNGPLMNLGSLFSSSMHVWNVQCSDDMKSHLVDSKFRTIMTRKLVFTKYMYSYLYDIARNGGTLHRPLFFEFQEDASSYKAQVDENFMLGESLKVSIKLDPQSDK